MVEDGVSSEPISVPNYKDYYLFAGSSFPSKTGPLFLETEGALASSDHKVKAEGSSGCPEMTPNGCLLLHRNQTAGVHGMIPGNVRQVDRAELQCFSVTLNSMISNARRHLTDPKASAVRAIRCMRSTPSGGPGKQPDAFIVHAV